MDDPRLKNAIRDNQAIIFKVDKQESELHIVKEELFDVRNQLKELSEYVMAMVEHVKKS